MRFTRPLLDSRTLARVLVLANVSTLVVTAASCASRDENPSATHGGDASPDAVADTDDAGVLEDAESKDADVVDAKPLAIECASPPCALTLSTTLRRDTNSREEGY